MILSKSVLVAASLALVARVSTGQLVINEIHRNPQGDKTERTGEWFELFNPTESPVDINGFSIKDDGSNSHVIDHGAPLFVPSFGYLVLGNNEDVNTNGGVTLDYAYDSDHIHLNNDFADELVLLDVANNEVDRVNWDGGFNGYSFPNEDGASMELLDPTLDNNIGSSWCNAVAPYGTDGNKGTPRAPNSCPPPGLVINEIMRDPAFVRSDRQGEWFELFNPTGRPLDINGWVIRDDGTNYHEINSGDPLVIVPGGYLILGNNDEVATNGGVPVDYRYDGNHIFLNNEANDTLVLMAGSVEVDRVNWDSGSSGAFPNEHGAAMALLDPSLDNNVSSNWCNANTPFGPGSFGTPGKPNICEGPPLVINEIMRNPANVASERDGEWFELFNPTEHPVDIEKWTIIDDGTNKHVINNGGPLVIGPGEYLVLGNNNDVATNGGVLIDYLYETDRIFLNNAADELVLLAGNIEIDRVNWDGFPPGLFPNEDGVAMALIDPALDNSVSSNWCSAAISYGNGDRGTPGQPNFCPPPRLIINEIMRNPKNVASERLGEWFELYNPTDTARDINGWTLKDDGSNSHVIDNGGPLIIGPWNYLVLGNNQDPETNGGVLVDYEYDRTRIHLNNLPDELVLLAGSVEVDRVNWDGVPPGAFPNVDGVAMALINPALDNNVSSNWCHASTRYGLGDFGTPHSANDCSDGYRRKVTKKTPGGIRGHA